MPIRVLIADDHAVVRRGLQMFLALDGEIEVVGEAENGSEALARTRELRPDVVLMDMLMPVMDGVAATESIRRELPDTEVIALTSVLDDGTVVGAVKAGAIGYLLKDTRADELCRAIKAAAAGQVQLSPQAAARLVREVRVPDVPATTLTERETDVLRLLASGRANKEIAAALSIGEKTVKTHVSSILGKLGVQSRTQAALYAAQNNIVPPETS
jgi:DNA-binding NarL/FixJ family response regulator